MNTTIQPHDITIDADTKLQTASFDYYSGIKFAKDNNLQQATSFTDVFKGTHFIVCCGDVMAQVSPDDYPDIERRII